MADYIMGSPSEPERIRFKTKPLLLNHHLEWAGVANGDTFVDFGCASGEVVRAAHALVGPGRAVGVDADVRMLEFAAMESRRLGLANVEYRQARVGELGSSGLSESSFDHAWARFFLEYMRDPVEVIREMTRVVRPGGKVTLIDIDGNCVWNYPMPSELQARMDEVMADLATTGFDPRVGVHLAEYADDAGLIDVREQIEPYHWVVGKPDEETGAAWGMKIRGIKDAYLARVAPDKPHMATFFDDFLEFVLADDTMTWSLAYLVQGTKR